MSVDKSKILTSVIAALVTALVLYLVGVLAKAPRIIIPSKAVVAFELAECPDGWSLFDEGAGRVVVGVGQAGPQGSTRKLLEDGGKETVQLTEEQMPRHDHDPAAGTSYYLFDVGSRGGGIVSNPAGSGWWAQARATAKTGGNEPHENMPPFVALRLCQRD